MLLGGWHLLSGLGCGSSKPSLGPGRGGPLSLSSPGGTLAVPRSKQHMDAQHGSAHRQPVASLQAFVLNPLRQAGLAARWVRSTAYALPLCTSDRRPNIAHA